jgi:hypothetical protein
MRLHRRRVPLSRPKPARALSNSRAELVDGPTLERVAGSAWANQLAALARAAHPDRPRLRHRENARPLQSQGYDDFALNPSFDPGLTAEVG